MRDLSYKPSNWCTNTNTRKHQHKELKLKKRWGICLTKLAIGAQTNTSPNANTRKHQYEHRHQHKHKRQHKELNLIKKRCKTCLQWLLDYAIKIAATWVACKKLHATIPRPFTLRIYHRTILKEFL